VVAVARGAVGVADGGTLRAWWAAPGPRASTAVRSPRRTRCAPGRPFGPLPKQKLDSGIFLA